MSSRFESINLIEVYETNGTEEKGLRSDRPKLLNHSSNTIGFIKLSSGGLTGTVADSRMIFSPALLAGATRIIVSHNHPSGTLKPSEQDITLTKKLKQAGDLIEITLLDHIIITAESYYSFADEGQI